MYVEEFAEMIMDSGNIVFLGGAGVSTESGVKDYRSKDGLYKAAEEFCVTPEEILSRSFFLKHPDVFYNFFRTYFVIEAEPNDAHKAIAELEKKGKLKAVITQNIDNLHQKAGNTEVIEVHGNTREFFCDKCHKEENTQKVMEEIMSGKVPVCAHCGGVIRPNVVMYEERLHDDSVEKAIRYLENAEMLIVGGTSLVVNPTASFIKHFHGKYLVIINETETPYDNAADLVIRDKIGEVFKKVMCEVI